ncbi:DUF389 domain-containing protein [Streptomyces sp. NPDC013187]|uniref:DUF389 domain-containing protein n=1 Tax=Streptomyces sp. NPDC013187 TaxID=3364865 RepID=UPI003691674C
MVATGLVGAVALARRDVAAVLPGAAIAIPLVPPFVASGVCLGDGPHEDGGAAVARGPAGRVRHRRRRRLADDAHPCPPSR